MARRPALRRRPAPGPTPTELRAEIEAALAETTRDAALELLEAAGIPAGPVLDVRDALRHPQAIARGMVIAEEDGFLTIGSPLRFGAGAAPPRRAPALGEHNDRIEAWLAESTRTSPATRAPG